MGALPKKRISRTRQARKRARYLKIKMPHMMTCNHCGTLRLAHTVCTSCGFYKGTEVLEIQETD